MGPEHPVSPLCPNGGPYMHLVGPFLTMSAPNLLVSHRLWENEAVQK